MGGGEGYLHHPLYPTTLTWLPDLLSPSLFLRNMDPITNIPEYHRHQADTTVLPGDLRAPPMAKYMVPEDIQYDGAVKVITKAPTPSPKPARSGGCVSKLLTTVVAVVLLLGGCFLAHHGRKHHHHGHHGHHGHHHGPHGGAPVDGDSVGLSLTEQNGGSLESFLSWLAYPEQEHGPEDSACSEPVAGNVEGGQMQPLIVDPLDDLLKLFFGQGLERADTTCLKCFADDAGRIRQAADSEGSAYMVYHLHGSSSVDSFEVVTHMFNPPANIATQPRLIPFSFFTAPDENQDGQPDDDSWEAISSQYESLGSVMGWEKGVFFGELSARPFLKIAFNDIQPATFRPQLGNVLLMSKGAQTDDGDGTVTIDTTQAAVPVEAPRAAPVRLPAAAPLVMQADE